MKYTVLIYYILNIKIIALFVVLLLHAKFAYKFLISNLLI